MGGVGGVGGGDVYSVGRRGWVISSTSFSSIPISGVLYALGGRGLYRGVGERVPKGVGNFLHFLFEHPDPWGALRTWGEGGVAM